VEFRQGTVSRRDHEPLPRGTILPAGWYNGLQMDQYEHHAECLDELLPPTARRRYEALAKLGEGGMGATLLVRDRHLGRQVALKLVRDEQMMTAGGRERLRREVELLLRLRHPNVIGVLDADTTAVPPYFTMEYVPGETLERLLADGPFEERRALELFSALAMAVAAAHAVGVLHRDIKPGNVIVEPDGTPRLIDFGLATLVASHELTALTRTGQVVGTAAYLPPEILSGERATEASDVYQLGVSLYETLTGRLPHSAMSLVAMAAGVRGDDQSPRICRVDGVSARTAEVVGRALATKPRLRQPSAAAFGEACRQALLVLDDPRPPAPAVQATAEPLVRRRRLGPVVFVCLALLVVWLVVRNPTGVSPSTEHGSGEVVSLARMREGRDTPDLPRATLLRSLVVVGRRLAHVHPHGDAEDVEDFWPVCETVVRSCIMAGDVAALAPLRSAMAERPAMMQALEACIERRGIDVALQTLRRELLAPTQPLPASVLFTEEAFVVLAWRLAAVSGDVMVAQDLMADSLAFRADFAARLGSPTLPVVHDVGSMVTGFRADVECVARGTRPPLDDAMQETLRLVLSSPDVGDLGRRRFVRRLTDGNDGQDAFVAALTTAVPPGRYWHRVGVELHRAHLVMRRLRLPSSANPAVFRRNVERAYWSFYCGTLGSDVEFETRTAFLDSMVAALDAHARLPASAWGAVMGRRSLLLQAVTQFIVLVRPVWRDDAASVALGREAVVCRLGRRLVAHLATHGDVAGLKRLVTALADARREGWSWQTTRMLVERASGREQAALDMARRAGVESGALLEQTLQESGTTADGVNLYLAIGEVVVDVALDGHDTEAVRSMLERIEASVARLRAAGAASSADALSSFAAEVHRMSSMKRR